MTILNALVTSEQVMIGVNTQQYALVGVDRKAANLKGPASRTSKMIPLAHVNAVLASRGSINFFVMLFANCNVLGGDDLETLIDNMPSLLVKTLHELRPMAQLYGITDMSHQVVLAGWSRLRKCGVCHLFELNSEGKITPSVIDDFLLGPWESSWGDAPRYTNQQEMWQVARAQARQIRQVEPTPGIGASGGQFLVARISAVGIAIELMGEIE